MARLKAEDVRNIAREELQKDREMQAWEEKSRGYSEEVKEIWSRLRTRAFHFKPNGEYDFQAVINEVLDTYWVIVEEELNES